MWGEMQKKEKVVPYNRTYVLEDHANRVFAEGLTLAFP